MTQFEYLQSCGEFDAALWIHDVIGLVNFRKYQHDQEWANKEGHKPMMLWEVELLNYIRQLLASERVDDDEPPRWNDFY